MSSALAQAQDHVGPALAARRAVVEFAEQGAMLGEVGIFLADAGGGQPVEHAELALAQPLVDDRLARLCGDAARLADRLGGLAGADIRRGQHDLGPLGLGQRGEPAAERARLLVAEVAQRHVDVAHRDVDHGEARPRAAASRATLPALWPWRTIHSFSGHLCLTPETKRERGERFRAGLRPRAARAGRRRR